MTLGAPLADLARAAGVSVDAGIGARCGSPRVRRVEFGEDTVGRYLRAWGFSPQKPMRRAYEQSDEAVRRWLEERYPEIERRARKERAEILWADESGLRSVQRRGARGRRSARPR